jgi:hypothetical protein
VILPLLARGIYHALGALQTAGEFISTGKRLVRDMRKGVIPHVDDTEPHPLPHKDSERIAEFGRRAGQGHETGPVAIPKPPRVPRI